MSRLDVTQYRCLVELHASSRRPSPSHRDEIAFHAQARVAHHRPLITAARREVAPARFQKSAFRRCIGAPFPACVARPEYYTFGRELQRQNVTNRNPTASRSAPPPRLTTEPFTNSYRIALERPLRPPMVLVTSRAREIHAVGANHASSIDSRSHRHCRAARPRWLCSLRRFLVHNHASR